MVRLAVRSPSPYRIMPSSSEPAAEVRSGRASHAWLTRSRAVWAASLAAHAVALAALAHAAVPLADLPPDEPERESRGLYVHAELQNSTFPFSPWVRACFDRNELRETHELSLPENSRPQYEPLTRCEGEQDGWARLDAPYYEGEALEEDLMASNASECFHYASMYGWGAGGRVFVRAERREDGSAIATAIPRSADARHEELLCCLRQAQGPLVSRLRPGGAVRFVLVFDSDRLEPPFMHIESTASSRGAGGPAALAALQRGFSR